MKKFYILYILKLFKKTKKKQKQMINRKLIHFKKPSKVEKYADLNELLLVIFKNKVYDLTKF